MGIQREKLEKFGKKLEETINDAYELAELDEGNEQLRNMAKDLHYIGYQLDDIISALIQGEKK